MREKGEGERESLGNVLDLGISKCFLYTCQCAPQVAIGTTLYLISLAQSCTDDLFWNCHIACKLCSPAHLLTGLFFHYSKNMKGLTLVRSYGQY